MEVRIFTMITRSGLHCGIGQGLSDIDLPTAKESVSGYPFVPGSTVKGVLRDRFVAMKNPGQKSLAAFGEGPGANKSPGFASALSFSDARLVCLPVRSYFGTFAYLASPYSLSNVAEMLRWAEREAAPSLPVYPHETDIYRASVTSCSRLVARTQKKQVLLEDLDLTIDEHSTDLADQWANQLAELIYPGDTEASGYFKERFVICDDDIMSFLCTTALPVAPHIQIAENGVVKDGALWLEEFVPPEAVFAGKVIGERGKGEKNQDYQAKELLDLVCGKSINCQIGGNATTGRGLVSMNFSAKEA